MMTNLSETRKLEAKKREWEEDLRESKRQSKKFRRWLACEIKGMIDYLMFYKKPKDKDLKNWHVAEVLFIYVVFYFALRGVSYIIFGR